MSHTWTPSTYIIMRLFLIFCTFFLATQRTDVKIVGLWRKRLHFDASIFVFLANLLALCGHGAESVAVIRSFMVVW